MYTLFDNSQRTMHPSKYSLCLIYFRFGRVPVQSWVLMVRSDPESTSEVVDRPIEHGWNLVSPLF